MAGPGLEIGLLVVHGHDQAWVVPLLDRYDHEQATFNLLLESLRNRVGVDSLLPARQDPRHGHVDEQARPIGRQGIFGLGWRVIVHALSVALDCHSAGKQRRVSAGHRNDIYPVFRRPPAIPFTAKCRVFTTSSSSGFSRNRFSSSISMNESGST